MPDSPHAEGGQPKPKARLDSVEQGARIFATTMIPVIVAVGGWAIQTTIEKDKEAAAKVQQTLQNAIDKEKISLEYVKIAKDILTSGEKEIPAELTTWSWRVLDGVSPIKFDQNDLKRLIERKERIPAPSTAAAPFSLSALAPEYDQLMSTAKVTSGQAELDAAVEKISANKAEYDKVEKTTGVPWFVIAVLHYQIADLDFGTHLHNGDPLTARTVLVPKGRPRTGEPPFSWHDSAKDALELMGVTNVDDWRTARILHLMEAYNGFGYRRHQVHTPHLWACTSHYTKGKFTSDHGFDPDIVVVKCGGAALLKRMMDRKLIAMR